jgi:uncharacterized protein YktB (UPF0637 family)
LRILQERNARNLFPYQNISDILCFMENSRQSALIRNLAWAFADGLLFYVGVKLAQGSAKLREEDMNDLSPLAERLGKVEDRHEELHAGQAPPRSGEGLDARVLQKVILALEARLSEHIGQVDRRVAEIDAKVALDLHAAETGMVSQSHAFEKAIQQIQTDLRSYVEAAQHHSAEQVAGVDQKVTALQDTLPAKFREIVEAVRQSMEARLALDLKEMEVRVQAHGVSAEALGEVETKLRAELEGLAARLAADVERLAGEQRGQVAPVQQGLQELDAKLTTLREELPPKIRQIVEAVEAGLNSRIAAGESQAAERLQHLEAAVAGLPQVDVSALEQKIGDLQQNIPAMEAKLATLREELPPKIRQIVEAVESSMNARLAASDRVVTAQFQQHAEQVSAVDQKLAVLQAELPPKFKAIVDAVRQSMDAKMAADLKALQDQHHAEMEQFRSEAAQRVAALETDLPARLNAMEERHRAQIEQAGSANGLRHELDQALQYVSLLEGRIQTLEQSMQRNFEETVERAAERIWGSLEARLQERVPAPAAPRPELITELRQKSTSAEQSVLDLIAGIGHLFDKPSAPAEPPPAEPEPPQVVAQPSKTEPEPPKAEAEPPKAAEPEPAKAAPETPAPPEPLAAAPQAVPEPAPEQPPAPASAAPETPPAATQASEPPHTEEKPPVILFKPKESGRKWRIPFVSSFFLVTLVLAWLQFP